MNSQNLIEKKTLHANSLLICEIINPALGTVYIYTVILTPCDTGSTTLMKNSNMCSL